MYRFSRAIYREIASEIIEDPHGTCPHANHERVLRACEAAIERLANDRHYFARPARTLFADVRAYVPMRSQPRVLRVIERYLACADEFLRSQPQNGYDLNGNPLQCRASTRKGTPASGCRCPTTATAPRTSIWPRPKSWSRPWRRSLAAGVVTCPIDDQNRPRTGRFGPCCWASTWAGRSPTPCWPLTDGWSRPRPRRLPQDQSEGVLAAIEKACERAGRSPSEIEAFSHGMTVATNALLEGRGARTALIATEGFTDLVELGRQDRAELYRLCAARPAPLVPAELRFGAPERMTPEGPLRELDEAVARDLVRELASAEGDPLEAVAVVLLHSYRHPEHEQAIGAALARRAARYARLPLARGRRHIPRVRARRHDRGRRRALAAAGGLPAPPAGGRASPRGSRSRRSCSQTAG